MDVLGRFKDVLEHRMKRPVSVSEAAFLIFEERADEIDRDSSRTEMLQHPTESLLHIRQKWETQHDLSNAEWDVVAEFVRVGFEERCQMPPFCRPTIPSRNSCRALLDAFEAVYRNRKQAESRHVWEYFSNLHGHSSDLDFSTCNAEQRDEALLDQIAKHRESLDPEGESWRFPGSVGSSFLYAVRQEGVEGSRLNQILAPYWPVLWRLAARGHWIRNDRPIRRSGAHEDDFRLRSSLPRGIENEEHSLRLTFEQAGRDIAVFVAFNGVRRFGFSSDKFPEIVELRSMLETLKFGPTEPWRGRTFNAFPSDDKSGYSLMIDKLNLYLHLSQTEWADLRDMMRQLWESPESQPWLRELEMEFGEQG